MLKDVRPPTENKYETHLGIAKQYGVKAAGLALLPQAWRIEFVALSVDTHKAWKAGGDLASEAELSELRVWLKECAFEQLILRSSGSSETLQDRGKFQSRVLKRGWAFDDLISELCKLYEDAQIADPNADLGIVVQRYVIAEYGGHLSNEHRVSPTINQWNYELELPQWVPSKGINTKFTTSPDPISPLRCGSQVPHQPLRSIGHFLVEEFSERCHLEWLVCNGILYLMQIDFEWPQLDQGLDPKKDFMLSTPEELNLENAQEIEPYKIGTETKWPKLQNLSDFDFDSGDVPSPRIYPLDPTRIFSALENQNSYDSLYADMTALTGDRLVVRTDCIQESKHKFNLPRTDTINVADAIKWCQSTSDCLISQGINLDEFIFLFHAFLPSKSSAWAYAKLGNPVVIVDALWGLPDGMQVLPVDTYEVNVTRQKIIGTKTTYKPSFLIEGNHGEWGYRSIKGRYGRKQVLSNSDKIEIATRTARIADKLQSDAQIMWFCEVPPAYQVGRNLPWFRSREVLDPSPRQEIKYKPYLVSNRFDLERLPPEKVTLQLSPEADLIRDNDFLESVIEKAKSRNLPVQLEGSILGHAYYRLNQENIPVVLKNAPKYYRKRNAQVFGKIVRDNIPASIVEGGETVKEARVSKSDLRIGLAGKLLEELDEFLRAKIGNESAAELADVLEVVKGLAHSCGHSWDEVESIAKEKEAKRGGFKEGKVLIETALPQRDSPIEREQQLRISDLGRVQIRENYVEVPPSALVATSLGPGVIFSFGGDTNRYRISMKSGKLIISKLDRKFESVPKDQQELF